MPAYLEWVWEVFLACSSFSEFYGRLEHVN